MKEPLDFVRMKGLEPPRLTTLDPKSSAATNYATCAIPSTKVRNILKRTKLLSVFFLSLFFVGVKKVKFGEFFFVIWKVSAVTLPLHDIH